MTNRLDQFWNAPQEPGPVRVDPNRAAAEALEGWFAAMLETLDPVTRDRLYALMVLLQHRYFYHWRRSPEPQRDPLHAAYEAAYDRLEELLLETNPPLPAMPSAPAAPVVPTPEPEIPQAAGVFYMEKE